MHVVTKKYQMWTLTFDLDLVPNNTTENTHERYAHGTIHSFNPETAIAEVRTGETRITGFSRGSEDYSDVRKRVKVINFTRR